MILDKLKEHFPPKNAAMLLLALLFGFFLFMAFLVMTAMTGEDLGLVEFLESPASEITVAELAVLIFISTLLSRK